MQTPETIPSATPGNPPHDLPAAAARIAELERQVALLAPDRRDFLDNLSVELRTPLQSILILSRLLEANEGGNLSAKQVEWASVITRSGNDLLRLIDELLALAQQTAAETASRQE